MAKKKIIEEKKTPWWKTALCNIFGIFFIVFPLLVYAGLSDYHASDPSFNKVTSEEVQNFLGKFGAYSADFVLSSFGLSLIIFLLVPIFWGIGLLKFKSFSEYKSRIFAWIVGVLCLACFIDVACSSYIASLNLPHKLTGDWSHIISRWLNNYINQVSFPYNSLIIKSIILFVSFLAFNFSSGITFSVWVKMFGKIGGFCKSVYAVCVKIFKKAANIRNFNEFQELNPRYLQEKIKNNSAQKHHNEPKFEEHEINFAPSFNASSSHNISVTPLTDALLAPSMSLNSQPTKSASVSGLTIEIPQFNNSVNDVTSLNINKNLLNNEQNVLTPTFDFMIDSEEENPLPKKAESKATTNNIYQIDGVKKFVSKMRSKNKSADTAQQDDLLTVPTSATAPQKPLQAQVAFNDSTAIEKSKDEYVFPDINLLSVPQNKEIEIDEEVLKKNAAQLEQVLQDFGIRGQIVKVRPGPVVTLYELEPAPGIRTARVIGLSDDIARSMAVASVRMAVVSGQKTIGIELPNSIRQTVGLRELLESKDFRNSKNILNVALGKDIGGQYVYADLAGMPHLLVAGTTGSGKSVGVNSMILSLLYRMTPEQCKFIMIDPKCVEFSMYNGIPHLLTPVITDPAKAVVGLKWAVQEMESRNRSLALLNVRNISGYNRKIEEIAKSSKEFKKTIQTGFDKETGNPIYEEQVIDTTPMPYIVIVVDEMADLMLVAGKEVEAAIQRLAQMGRAVGIHLIMATQRPSVDVITGVIKANFPSRISFHVTNKFDSTTIIGEKGAEQLLGRGDMLFVASGDKPRRVHGCFVPDDEVEKIVEFIKEQGEPKYVAEVTAGELNSKDSGPVFDKGEMGDAGEDLYRQAVDIVRTDKKASTSYVQRKLRIGYNRAANLIERMEDEGIVSHPDHVGRREVIG